jgi:Zn-dependent protease
MSPGNAEQSLSGSFRFFSVAGIAVHLHWSWFLVAAYEFQFRASAYNSQIWNVAEYLTLFAIVLLHEFGHALACRQVGGRADRIVLWPLGGVAFVSPPPRPEAWLWSIAAGPLVNLILLPVLVAMHLLAAFFGLANIDPDAAQFVTTLSYMNAGLLFFNLLPIYPLDGGQILQALLWFVIGRARSLMVVSVLGFIVGAGVVILAALVGDLWLVVIAAFIALQSLAGFGRARLLARQANYPRHIDATCPRCGNHPQIGHYWRCDHCRQPFDAILHRAECPKCGNMHATTSCPECWQSRPIEEWIFARDRRAETDTRSS